MTAARVDAPPSFVMIGDAPVIVGRSHDATLRLLHATVSRRHATVTRSGEGLASSIHDSRFGTFVNGTRIRNAREPRLGIACSSARRPPIESTRTA